MRKMRKIHFFLVLFLPVKCQKLRWEKNLIPGLLDPVRQDIQLLQPGDVVVQWRVLLFFFSATQVFWSSLRVPELWSGARGHYSREEALDFGVRGSRRHVDRRKR